MQIKVCGLTDTKNMIDVIGLLPDYIGFIFYQGSVRCIKEGIAAPVHKIAAANNVKKVGVFVNALPGAIRKAIDDYQLDMVQLHGLESVAVCKTISRITPVIKAFHLHDDFDFNSLGIYGEWCRYFLFDTASPQYGGTGKTFNWTLLDHYQLTIPFFLSGGIALEHIPAISAMRYPALQAIDVNSRFEHAPGIKDVERLKKLFYEIRN